jgi:hypothetical protein
MSWWRRIFSLSSSSPKAAHSAPDTPYDDLDDDLLVAARTLVALTGPKTPYELIRHLKIGHGWPPPPTLNTLNLRRISGPISKLYSQL